MGQKSSTTRKIEIENPIFKTKELDDSLDKKLTPANRKNANVVEKDALAQRKYFVSKIFHMEENKQDLRSSYLKITNDERRNEPRGESIRQLVAPTEEDSEFEATCRQMKEVLIGCLTSKSGTPLTCDEQVTRFLSYILKCKFYQIS